MVSKRFPRPEVSSFSLNRSLERENVVQKPPKSLSNTFLIPVNPSAASSPPYKPLWDARPACIRLTMEPYWAAIRPDACVPAIPNAWTVCSFERRKADADADADENTPTVDAECQPWAKCSAPMQIPTRGPVS